MDENLTKNLLILFGLLAVIIITFGTLAYGALLAAPWVPLRQTDVRRMLKKAKIKPGERLFDLGSGDGRIVIEAAQHFGAQATGFEVALLPYCVSRVKIILCGLTGRAKVRCTNFFQISLAPADVVCVFLSPWAMQKLESKFEKELKPGARVISCAFQLPHWIPDFVDKETQKEISIFHYTKK